MSQTARIHTFGIGRDCDKKLVEETAYAGRGSCSFAYDNINLAKQVVDALRKSSQPSLSGCILKWPGREIPLREVFRDDSIYSYQIMTISEFKSLKVEFCSELDPLTNKPIALTYS
jgi:hypothetical protein